MNGLRKAMAVFGLVACTAFGVGGCAKEEEKGPAEEYGELRDAMKEAGEAADEAAEEVDEAAEELKKKEE